MPLRTGNFLGGRLMAETRQIGFEDRLEAAPDALVGVDPRGRREAPAL